MVTADSDYLNAQYNNRALVPDYADYFARWTIASVALREQPGCAVSLPYGRGERETLDVFAPQTPDNAGRRLVGAVPWSSTSTVVIGAA